MDVDLTAFFNPRGALIHPDRAELAIARAFAAAANASHKAHHGITAASECVAVTFAVGLRQPSWTRHLKDVVLRCVDRAMGRVCPQLDVLQYISNESPAFVSRGADGGAAKAPLQVVFHVRPSSALLPPSLLKQHTVEGTAVEGVELPEPEDVAAITAAASETMKDSLTDMDLWYRARAAHQQYDSSIPLDSIQRLAGSLLGPDGGGDGAYDGAALQAQQRRQEEKLEQLQWQLARWLTELFLNEGGWARLHGSSSSTSTTSNNGSSATTTARGTGDNAARRLFHAPLRPAFPHVVDAALFANPPRPPTQATSGDAPSGLESAARRQLHADVRGMEFDGLLLGYTARYAYVAVPYFVSSTESTTRVSSPSSSSDGQTCVWSIVSRLPVPSFVREEVSPQSAEEADATSTHRKRTRAAAADEGVDATPSTTPSKENATLAQTVLSHCFNVEEAMRHDTNAASGVFRLTEVPYLVTVRAHRVYCTRADPTKQPQLPPTARTTSLCAKKPHPAASPYKLSVVLEDAYVVAHRRLDEETTAAPSQTHWAASLFGLKVPDSATPTAAFAMARSLHTFPDVVSVMRESCHRFTRSHERFCGVYQRCLEVKRQPTPAAPGSEPESNEAPHAVGEVVADAAVTEQTAEPQSELPSQAVAAQQLRLLRRAEEVYVSIADSMSVHYKKLRGAARVAVPAVRTSADVPGLEEGNNVEFKAKVGLSLAGDDAAAVRGRGRQTSTMDTERLRNTIAAMAACRGGVILIGVADDGRILGHPTQLAVSKHLRTSGFCPAMVKDAVQVKELRWRDVTAASAAAGADGASDAPAKRTMPANWWKAGGGATTSGEGVKAGVDKATGQRTQGGGAVEQVITVINVEKGQAPFYATAKNTPPYQRGCASTVVMPTVVLARRLMKELA